MNVLVITDNVLQYENIKLIIKTKDIKGCFFDFRHSPLNSPMEGYAELKAMDVNVQAEEIIEKYELVLSVHCFQIFPEVLVRNVRCINIHPGFNPMNRGWYPQVFAIVNRLPIGATIHEMDERLDHGPIIVRKLVNQELTDTSYSLYHKVVKAEMELFEEYFDAILNRAYVPFMPDGVSNIFFKKDFNELCEIKLNEAGCFLDFYNRLRALTHDPYVNAYFINPETQKKVYISINIDI